MTDLPLETADHRDARAVDGPEPAALLRSGRQRWPGRASICAAVLMVALWLVGYAFEFLGSAYWSVVGLASAVLTLLAIAIAFGIVAIVRGQGRALGVAGILISVSLNPFAVLWVLSLVSGLFR